MSLSSAPNDLARERTCAPRHQTRPLVEAGPLPRYTAMKRCRTCLQEKPETEFWGLSPPKKARQTECKSCMRARTQRWRKRNPEKAAGMAARSTRKTRLKNIDNSVIYSARWRSAANGLEFSLSNGDLVIPSFCPILGIPLKSTVGRGRTCTQEERDRRPSIDRIDNSRGYTADNVIVVSYRANRLKSDASVEELELLARFYRRLKNGRRKHAEENRNNPEDLFAGHEGDDVPQMLANASQEKR